MIHGTAEQAALHAGKGRQLFGSYAVGELWPLTESAARGVQQYAVKLTLGVGGRRC